MDDSVSIRFGRNVKQFRLARGLSQEELADLAGVHRTYIGMVERAEKNITLESADKIAVALAVKLEKLLR